VIISEALEAAGITATLSGGGAVSIYSHNQYMSHDLDFVTSADPKSLLNAIAHLGFVRGSKKRLYEHPRTKWLVEFPAGPSALEISIFQTHDQLRSCRLCMDPFARDHANPLCDRPISCLRLWVRSAMLGSGSHGLPKPFD
jgi:hypothetical protein